MERTGDLLHDLAERTHDVLQRRPRPWGPTSSGANGVVRGPYATGGKIVGVGYGAGDERVFAVRKDGRMVAFRAANGERVT